MDSRAQFEEWFKPKKIAMQNRGISTVRIVRLCQRQWEAWQASRAVIEVDLPEKVMVEDEYDRGHNYGIEYCEEAIIASGLSIKGE